MAENIYIFYSAIKYLLLCWNTQFIAIHNKDSQMAQARKAK